MGKTCLAFGAGGNEQTPRLCLTGGGGGGKGSGTQKFVYQKLPDKIFPVQISFFLTMVSGGGEGVQGGGGTLLAEKK